MTDWDWMGWWHIGFFGKVAWEDYLWGHWNDNVASYGKLPNKGRNKCKVPETGMNVKCSSDRKEGIVAKVQATRRKGRWNMGCKAQREGREGLKGYGKESEHYSECHQEWCEYWRVLSKRGTRPDWHDLMTVAWRTDWRSRWFWNQGGQQRRLQ